MSYIPNSAMPHARADNDQSSPRDWREHARAYLTQARDLGRRGLSLARRHPRETAAAGAAGGIAVIAGLGYALWQGRRRRFA